MTAPTSAESRAVARCRDIVLARYDMARRERQVHLLRGPRLGNVEALAATLKMAWARNVLRDIDAEFPPPDGSRPIPD